jgi:hypothetical protein
LKTTSPKTSTDHHSGIGVLVIEANLDQMWQAVFAPSQHWGGEETLALIPEENVPKNLAKP